MEVGVEEEGEVYLTISGCWQRKKINILILPALILTDRLK